MSSIPVKIGYATAYDTDILAKARDEGRIIITLDADFHALLALSGATSPTVIRVRIEGLRGADMAGLLQKLVMDWGEQLESGVVMSVQSNRIRLRHLPLTTTDK